MRINEDEYRKAEKRFGAIGSDGKRHEYLPIVRAVEEACRNVELDLEDLEIITQRIRENAIKAGKSIK